MNKIPVRRIIVLTILAILSCFVVYLFVTTKTYTQLGIAVLSYPILAFLIIKAIPRKTRKELSNVISKPPCNQNALQPAVSVPNVAGGGEEIADIDKRSFLKLVGATGIFFFATSLIGKWLGTLPFSQTPPLSGVPANTNASQGATDSGFSTNGYTITEIDEGLISYYGFTNKSGAWLIMKEDSDSNSFRYAKGDTNFPSNWKGRSSLMYDYYYNLE